MAGVDALLNLLVAQRAEGLSLAAGRAPALVSGGERRLLSMPPLQDGIFARFVDEVREASIDGIYLLRAREGDVRFTVEIDTDAAMEFRRTDVAPQGTGARMPDREVSQAEATDGPGGLEAIVARAFEREAIDVFVSTTADARLRVGRELESIPGTCFAAGEILSFLGLSETHRLDLEQRGSVDLSIEFGGDRARANVFCHQEGIAAVLRPIRRGIRSLADLGLPADLVRLVGYPDGLVLLVGPTGSGKSSTLAALIDHLNHHDARHIVTIEDPIEFRYAHGRCLIHQREVGRHVRNFADGLRAALREGPDVILVGEMRDPETIGAALTAAETGHLVLSTLHAGSAAMAVDRIIDAFAPHQQAQVRWQLAGSLRAIMTQVLLPGRRSGRLVPAVEKMLVTPGVAANIREGRGHHIASQIQTGRDEGMISLELSLADLVRRGEIGAEIAAGAGRHVDLLRQLPGG